jgi:hypothetical protein
MSAVPLDKLHRHLKIYNIQRKMNRVTELAGAAAKFTQLGEEDCHMEMSDNDSSEAGWFNSSPIVFT